jgi:hypothetical protein
MTTIIPGVGPDPAGNVGKSGFTLRREGVAPGRAEGASCPPMMPKRVVAAVLVAALVLLGGGVLTSLFF